MKAHFPQLDQADIAHGESTKRVWALPLDGQTSETGTAYARALHVEPRADLSVEEVDLDVAAESDAESDVDSARCDTEDDELSPGVYRDADGIVHDLDDGSYGTGVLGSCDSPPPSPHHVIYDSDY